MDAPSADDIHAQGRYCGNQLCCWGPAGKKIEKIMKRNAPTLYTTINRRTVTLKERQTTMEQLRTLITDAHKFSVHNVPDMMLIGDGDGASTLGVESLLQQAVSKLNRMLDRVRHEAIVEKGLRRLNKDRKKKP